MQFWLFRIAAIGSGGGISAASVQLSHLHFENVRQS